MFLLLLNGNCVVIKDTVLLKVKGSDYMGMVELRRRFGILNFFFRNVMKMHFRNRELSALENYLLSYLDAGRQHLISKIYSSYALLSKKYFINTSQREFQYTKLQIKINLSSNVEIH